MEEVTQPKWNELELNENLIDLLFPSFFFLVCCISSKVIFFLEFELVKYETGIPGKE